MRRVVVLAEAAEDLEEARRFYGDWVAGNAVAMNHPSVWSEAA